MWKKLKQTEFFKKLKQFPANKSVYITAITLLVALAVLITVTAISNRNKKIENPPKQTDTDSKTPANDSGNKSDPSGDQAGKTDLPGSETDKTGDKKDPGTPDSQTTGALPTAFLLPTDGMLGKSHDDSIQVWSNTMNDWRIHLGVDITTPEAAPVCAAADGTVAKVWEDPLMGWCVALSHSGDCLTFYKNLSEDLATGIVEGANVVSGQKIGCVGDSATLELAEEPHLHFEMTVGGLQVDPLEYFDAESVATLAQDTGYEDQPTGSVTDDAKAADAKVTATATDTNMKNNGGKKTGK